MRLIDADTIKYKQQVMYKKDDSDDVWAERFTTATEIANAPTIDAEPVVRCKDCKYSRKDELWHMRWCKGLTVKDEHFCADGERKDDE